MDDVSETGRVVARAAPARPRRGYLESRPQLEELRSGEWVTEPGLPEAVPPTGPARLTRDSLGDTEALP